MIPLARWAIEPPQTQLAFYTLGRDSLTAPHTDAIKVHPQGVHTLYCVYWYLRLILIYLLLEFCVSLLEGLLLSAQVRRVHSHLTSLCRLRDRVSCSKILVRF